mgnify:FL=1
MTDDERCRLRNRQNWLMAEYDNYEKLQRVCANDASLVRKFQAEMDRLDDEAELIRRRLESEVDE